MLNTRSRLFPSDFPPVYRTSTRCLQVNLGYRCNQSCQHCHVNAGPQRTEEMSGDIVEQLINFLRASDIRSLDLTGGAPELHPLFRRLVHAARELGISVIDRCNLTVLEEPGQKDLAQFLASQQVRLIASLPCYLETNVDRQRGPGVFQASLRALNALNALGFGLPGSNLILDLMHNPGTHDLPSDQLALEQAYRRELGALGIAFHHVLTLTNMPIQRFGSQLVSQGQWEPYLLKLKMSHCPDNLIHLMCRDTLSIDWRGQVYDCDFNQMLDLPLQVPGRAPIRLADLQALDLQGLQVQVAQHCYGCTSGQGSSCSGALAV